MNIYITVYSLRNYSVRIKIHLRYREVNNMATHFCDKCMATAHLGGEPSKLCDQPPHHFVAIVVQPAG